MAKKTTKKSEAPIKEVAEQALEQIQAAAAAEQQEPKKRKMVEFSFLASLLEYATEKASLIVLHTASGEEVKFWIAKSQSHFIIDADKPENMICRVPAWLYFKKGLNKYFAIDRWTQVAI